MAKQQVKHAKQRKGRGDEEGADRLVWSMAVDTPDTAAPDTAASPGDHASCGDCAPCDDVYQHRYIHNIVTYTYPDSHDVSKMQYVCVRACACVSASM